MATIANIMSRQKAWAAVNPLRRWREEHELSRLSLASTVGVSLVTIQAWESGATRPNASHMEALERLSKSLKQEWSDWETSRPKL